MWHRDSSRACKIAICVEEYAQGYYSVYIEVLMWSHYALMAHGLRLCQFHGIWVKLSHVLRSPQLAEFRQSPEIYFFSPVIDEASTGHRHGVSQASWRYG